MQFPVKTIQQRQTRIAILQAIAEQTGLKRVEVEAVFTSLARLVEAHMKKAGSGEIIIPKLGLKLRRVSRKPTKKRTTVSPITGKTIEIPAKPARADIKLIALKALKVMLLEETGC